MDEIENGERVTSVFDTPEYVESMEAARKAFAENLRRDREAQKCDLASMTPAERASHATEQKRKRKEAREREDRRNEETQRMIELNRRIRERDAERGYTDADLEIAREEAGLKRARELVTGKANRRPGSLASRINARTGAELAASAKPTVWRVQDLLKENRTLILAADKKAGKSTVILNLMRCLVDGGDFLGQFAVTPLPDDQTVVYLDYEMSDDDWEEEFARANIRNGERIIRVSLLDDPGMFDFGNRERGEGSPHEGIVDYFVGVNCGFLFLDPFRPAFDAFDLNTLIEAHVERFLRGVTSVLQSVRRETGHSVEFFGAHHTKQGTEKASGAGNWGSWPDVPASLSVDAAGVRWFRVEQGRSRIKLDRTRLRYDPDTVTLSTAASPVVVVDRTPAVRAAVLALVGSQPGLPGKGIAAALDHPRDSVYAELKTLVTEGKILAERRGRNVGHRLAPAG